MRLINADDVKELLIGLDSLPWEEEVDDLVNSLPTIEAVPMVHGEWIAGKMLFENDVCSVCGTGIYNTVGMNFCPNCGAKMDGKAV